MKQLFVLAILCVCWVIPAQASTDASVARVYRVSDTEISALMYELDTAFSKATGKELDWQDFPGDEADELLPLATRGEVDLVVTNDPTLLQALKSKGLAGHTVTFMENTLFLVGPQEDPAAVRGMNLEGAFAQIAKKQALFVSPMAGGNFLLAERALWKSAGIANAEELKGYISSGRKRLAGMMQASDERAYMLIDPLTYMAYRRSFEEGTSDEVVPLVVPRDVPENRYWAVVIRRSIVGKERLITAEQFVKWLGSEEAQAIVEAFEASSKALLNPVDWGR